MKKLGIYFCVLMISISFSELRSQTLFNQDDHAQKIDFRLFYPIQLFKDKSMTRRQLNFAGFDTAYHFMFTDRFALSGIGGAWFIPVRKVVKVGEAAKSAILYSLFLQLGPTIQAFPKSYFDPSIGIHAGAALTDVGAISKSKFTFPMVLRVGLNLFRETERFQDTSLALRLVGNAIYSLHQVPVLKPWYFDFGLTFSGTF